LVEQIREQAQNSDMSGLLFVITGRSGRAKTSA